MEISKLGRDAVSMCVTVAMLAGCSALPLSLSKGQGGAEPPLVHRAMPASSFRVLHSFDGDPDGETPNGDLDNLNGTLYGTTFYGGTHRVGTAFSISIDGTEKVLHSFGAGSDGIFPYAGLIHLTETAKDTLYGTTRDGGTSDKGTVYSIGTDGTEKVLHSFGGGSDGAAPFGNLAHAHDTLYGTTRDGGPSDNGTVYVISADGAEKVLHHFGGGSDGAKPIAGLIDANGTFYGTTTKGGTSDKGTVYSIGADGTEKVLYSFAGGSDGASPSAGLIDVRGTLYGTTDEGGTLNRGTVYSITTDGTEKVLHSFGSGSDGAIPLGGLSDVKGVLYGTTFLGGSKRCFGSGCGTIYSITTDGTETVLYSFGGYDGFKPEARLLHHNGTLYGTTDEGGNYDRGTVYALTL